MASKQLERRFPVSYSNITEICIYKYISILLRYIALYFYYNCFVELISTIPTYQIHVWNGKHLDRSKGSSYETLVDSSMHIAVKQKKTFIVQFTIYESINQCRKILSLLSNGLIPKPKIMWNRFSLRRSSVSSYGGHEFLQVSDPQEVEVKVVTGSKHTYLFYQLLKRVYKFASILNKHEFAKVILCE